MIGGILAIMGIGIIDAYFIGFLGTEPLAALGFVFPVITIFNSVALGFGMAISSLTSKLIGEQKTDNATRLISTGIAMSFLIAVVLALAVGMNIERIFIIAGADNSTLPFIHEYMRVFVFVIPLLLVMLSVSSTYRAIGNTAMSANVAIGVTVINIAISPLLIFGIGPFPEMEMAGAALGSLIAVLVMTLYSTFQLAFNEKLLHFSADILVNAKNNIQQLLTIAIPATFSNIISPLSAAILTFMVAKYGTEAVAAFGVGIRIERMSMLFAFALSSTLPMFIGQNLGAKKTERVAEAVDKSFRFIMLLQIGIWVGLILLSKPISALFSKVDEVRHLIELYLWILPSSFGFAAVVILATVSMNVFGKPNTALLVNLVRLVLLYLPFALLGGYLDEVRGIYIGIGVANIFAYLFCRRLFARILNEHQIIPGKSSASVTNGIT
jgi:putative MATE family efflux protein